MCVTNIIMESLHKCHNCNKECVRIKTSYNALTHRTRYINELGKVWRSPNSCPECSKLYHRKRMNAKPHNQLKCCKVCNKDFLSNRAWQTICGNSCKKLSVLDANRQARRASVKHRACICNKDLTGMHLGRRYCSLACKSATNRKPRAPRQKPVKQCPICQGMFERKVSAAKFCSKDCAKKNTRKTKKRYNVK